MHNAVLVIECDVMWSGLSELDDERTRDGTASFRRPPADSDRLSSAPGDGDTPAEHPPVTPGSWRDRRPERPVVHLGVVATGHVVDHCQRQRHLDDRNVRAFDAGFEAVLESVEGNRKESFVLVRGVCDYGDGTAADHKARRGETDWRPYSALAAAAVMKSIVLDIVVDDDDDD